jgi:diguanylate cyclase (GGDEF)-like protein
MSNGTMAAVTHEVPVTSWHPGVRLVLALLVLFPALAMVFVMASGASAQWSSRQEAQVVAGQATELQALARARGELVSAVTPLEAVSYARGLGISTETLSTLLHVNFARAIRLGVASIADDPVFRSTPTLRADDTALLTDVPKVNSNAITFDQLDGQTTKFLNDLVQRWDSQYNTLEGSMARWQPPGTFGVQMAAQRQTYEAFVEGGFAVQGEIDVMTGAGGLSAKQQLIGSETAYDIATQDIDHHLGPKSQAAWNTIKASPATRKFQGTLQEATEVALGEQSPPWQSDPALAGPAMISGLEFLGDINNLAQSASADLHDSAQAQASVAARDFLREVGFLVLVAVVSFGGVAVAGRFLTRPLRQLARAAHQVSDGEFDLEVLSDRGPREVVTINRAFNDMASTLQAVESKAVALGAEDLSHPEIQIPLPGRTGRALQAAVDRLTHRIGEGERQRQALHEVATHDRLTGLLNRAAIFDFLNHDVSERRHHGETVAVLFVDLDGLKVLNDTYGHEVGDQAIVATAEALSETIGTYGVVGRLGGDEFLVVLSGEERRQVRSVADRMGNAVAARVVSVGGTTVPLRCSIGVAFADQGSDFDPMELVRQADEAMYEAKRAAHSSAEQFAAALLTQGPSTSPL